MTESFGPYCGDPLDRDLPPEQRGSCGRPFADVELRIVDVDDGTELPAGRARRDPAAGPEPHARDLRADRATRSSPSTASIPPAISGTSTRDGYLFFTGRRDDMFKVKGATVYPSEVEAALHANPDVQRAVVVDLGEHPATRVGALVVLQPGREVAVDELRRDAATRLSAFKVPTHVGDRRGRRHPDDGHRQDRQGRRPAPARRPGVTRPTTKRRQSGVIIRPR